MLKPRTLAVSSLVVMLLAVMALPSLASAANDRYRINARLFGPTALKGKARYEERTKSGSLMRRFQVEVERGTPGQSLAILVNGDQVGTIVVGPLGRGKLQLRTPQHIDSPGDGQPMPPSFPRLVTGDNVAVGPITGTMFVVINNSSTTPPTPNVQLLRLRSEFAGDGASSGKVEYRERFKNTFGLERRFKVEIEDAQPNTSYQVRINGVLVVTITTNGSGFEEFQYRTAAFIDSPGDGIPMPATFPSLKAGDVVTVGIMQTTLQPKN